MPEFEDARGVAIVYDVYPAEGPARGVVQIAHGVGEHAGRYRDLAERLTRVGFHVYADDHRGHGRTGLRQHGGPERLGHLGRGGLRAAVDAVGDFTRLIRHEYPDLPLVLVGHSWGSFLAQILVDADPADYDALVLSGSALRWPGSLNAGPLNAPWAGPDANGVEWLTTDVEVQRAFLDDPLSTDVPLLKLFGPIEALRLFGRPRPDIRARRGEDLPVLLLVGRDDTVGGPRSVHRLADAYRNRSGLEDVTTFVYPDVRHEVLRHEEAVEDLLRWLDARIPPLG